jgi:tripartite-type tricarboxylate transporter receptor subunit TctC
MKFLYKGLAAAAISMIGLGANQACLAQNYPERPITLVVPFTAGGITDLLSRTVGEALSKRVGQPVVVENRPGAGGSIGMESVARAKPDGYTIGIGTRGTQATNLMIYDNIKYDPIKDFEAIHTIGDAATVLVANPNRPYKSVAELIAYARANPGKVNFGTAGNGTAAHLTGVLFQRLAKVQLVHVPYRGSAPAVQDLMAGVVDIAFDYPASTIGAIQAGRLTPLAVMYGERISVLPDVPTIAEAGLPGAEASSWMAMFVPAGTPKPAVEKLVHAMSDVMADPEIKKKIEHLGAIPLAVGGDDLTELVKKEIVKWGEVVKQAGLKAN